MTGTSLVPVPAEPPQRLMREWIACALVAALARFVPLPLVDDVIQAQATRLSVTRTVRAAGRQYPISEIDPILGGRSVTEMVKAAAVALPLKIALYPVRKIRRFVGAVHGVPSDLATVLLLSWTVHRRLAAGGLSHPDARVRRDEAEALRRAFDAVRRETDLQVITSALRDALGNARSLTTTVGEYGRRLLSRRDGEAPPEPSAEMADDIDRIEAVLRAPEIRRIVADFDARVDWRLAYGDPRRAVPDRLVKPEASGRTS
jgi:hypothetical protein